MCSTSSASKCGSAPSSSPPPSSQVTVDAAASSSTNNKLSWIAGAYFFDETDDNPETEFANQQPQLGGTNWNVINLGKLYTNLSNYPGIAGTATGATDAYLGNVFNSFYANNAATAGTAAAQRSS